MKREKGPPLGSYGYRGKGAPLPWGLESPNPDRSLSQEPGGTLVDVSLCVDGGGVPILGVLGSSLHPGSW